MSSEKMSVQSTNFPFLVLNSINHYITVFNRVREESPSVSS